jgi:hypothetical protein
VAKHLLMTPFGPVDPSFSWMGATPVPPAGVAASRRRRGRHAAMTAPSPYTTGPGPSPYQLLDPVGTAPHPATTSPTGGVPSEHETVPAYEASHEWASGSDTLTTHGTSSAVTTTAPAQLPAEAPFRLPVRPRPSPEQIRYRIPPADRPDIDILRRVLAALYRL